MAKAKIPRSDVYWVQPEDLKIEEDFNVRYDYGDLESLCASIIENGVKVPLIVHKERGEDGLIVTDGHRRYKAIMMAVKKGIENIRIPVIKQGLKVSPEDRVLGMVLYNDGKRLTLLEEADVYKRLFNYGWSQTQIAKKVGKSDTHIANCFLLSNAPMKLKNEIKAGKVSASTVIEELKEASPEEVSEKIEKAIDDNGGKKVSKKHLAKDIKLSEKDLHELYVSLEKLGSEVETITVNTIYSLLTYSRGKIDKKELISALKK